MSSDGSKSGARIRGLGGPEGLPATALPFSSAENLRFIVEEEKPMNVLFLLRRCSWSP